MQDYKKYNGDGVMFSIHGKRALITGATGGIGAACAQKMHAAGAKVIITGTRENALNDLATHIGSMVDVITCNLSDMKAAANLFNDAQEKFGEIDILVCNAGITRDCLMMKMTDEQWNEVIAVNLSSVFAMNRAAVKSMMKRRKGRIINISSLVGVSGNFGQANYSASKAGLIGMTKSIALECATRSITANCIAPGFIKTPMTDDIPTNIVKEKILPKIPMGIFGTPDDIAYATLYLASDEAKFITGQTIHVNGGMLLV